MKSEYEQYEYHHRARIAMKPGITGMWQVSGRSDITDFEEVVRLDTEYTLATENNIQPNLLRNWKKEFLNNASAVFDDKREENLKEKLAEERKEKAEYKTPAECYYPAMLLPYVA